MKERNHPEEDIHSTIHELLRTRSLSFIIDLLKNSSREAEWARVIRSVAVARIEQDKLWKQVVNPETGQYFTTATDYFKSAVVQDDLRIRNRRILSRVRIEGRVLLLLHNQNLINLETFTSEMIDGWTKLQYFEQAMENQHDEPGAILEVMKQSTKDEFIAYSQGRKVSYRSETHKKQIFQRYFLGYPVEKEGAPVV